LPNNALPADVDRAEPKSCSEKLGLAAWENRANIPAEETPRSVG